MEGDRRFISKWMGIPLVEILGTALEVIKVKPEG